ncbi:MAG: hypothetical protein IT281_01635 [Ignavibacteria bacterium]|nr:hypothetical protein [Ignavibacteria bacterium]
MKKSKLITLLRTFTTDEMKDFGKFISSPYFATGRNLRPLYCILKKYYPEFDSSSFTEEKVFNKLFLGKKYSGKRSMHAIHVSFSEMFTLAEKFMVYNEIENGSGAYAYYEQLSSAYHGKDLHDSALKAIRKCEDILDKAQDEYHMLHKKIEILQSITGFYHYKNLPQKGYDYSVKLLFYAVADFIRLLSRFTDNYFLFKNSLNLTSSRLDVVRKFLDTIDLGLMEGIAEDESNTKQVASINYYLLQSLVNNDNKNYLNEAIEIYISTFHNLSETDKLNLFFMLFSRQCSVLKKDILYLKEADKFFDLIAGNHIFRPNSKHSLVASFYEAALKMKCAMYNDRKIDAYIKKFSKFIETDKKEGMMSLSNCLLLFKQKKYNECLKIISKYGSFNGINHNDYYRLKSLCLYELRDTEGFFSVLNSYEKYSRNNESVSENSKREHLNFIKAVKLLNNIKIDNDNAEEAKRITELIKNNIYCWWFKEKLEEL